jgi:hypothetical protein
LLRHLTFKIKFIVKIRDNLLKAKEEQA